MNEQSETASSSRIWQPVLMLGCLLAATIIVVACSNGVTMNSTSGMGTVNVMLSDPATCASPDGPFSHVYVTITDVRANASSTASSADGSWVDLTPNLSSSPKQIDLLAQANNQCFLASLGDAQQLQTGSYRQIRLILASDSTSISNNACTNGSANCVVLTADSSFHTLQLSSEDKTGIKIPSGQIASGAFTIAAGQTEDLDIDFLTCESIHREGNGQFRLKPVLHAGEVSTTSSSINGVVLDGATGKPVAGSVFVSVEQKDASGVDRVIQSVPANADGSFVFCPLTGTAAFDVVIVGTRSDGTLYQPSIVTGVAIGSTTGNVNLYPSTLTAANSVASITGLVTSQNSSSSATTADVTLSALEMVNSTTYTIPMQPATSPIFAVTQVVTTAVSNPPTLTCPTGTDCIDFSLPVASGGPYIGAWSASGSTLTQSAPLGSYTVDGIASTCSPTEQTSTPAVALTGSGPFSVSIPNNLAFTGCQ